MSKSRADIPALENVPIPFHKYKTVELNKGTRRQKDEWYSMYGNFCTKYRKANQIGKELLKAQYG